MGPEDAARRSSRLAVARSLAIDAYTAEVVAALRRRGIRAVLLKGPALATWLYGAGPPRPYVDSDLLVAPNQLTAAEGVLSDLGFAQEAVVEDLTMHAHAWIRPTDGAQVDLHRSLAAISVGPTEAWQTISSLTETARVGGALVEVPRVPARALIVALHVAHHGSEARQPMEDLRRAIDQLPQATWIEAAAIAERLNAVAPFATALRTLPHGARLAAQLGLASSELIEAAMQPGSRSGLVLGLERLAGRQGVRGKLALLGRELFPTRDFIRWWWPPAGAGPAMLAFGYGWRILWLLLNAWPSVRARRRIRRRVRA